MNTPHPSSVPGDFYVINECCLACGAPQSIAPNLIGTESPSHHCFWKKQPETPAEVDQAIKIILTQELDCHRYAGADPVILDRLVSTGCCDAFPSRSYHPIELRSYPLFPHLA